MESYTIKNLTFAYPDQERKVLDQISLSINQGEFVVLCGPSGSGKTTLLRQLKTVLSPHGNKTGTISFEETPLEELDQRDQSSRIGFVLQSPENQLVTDKVWHELAFGLESLGYDTGTIRLRVAEMASFFGIQSWFYKDVGELSGGQKQILNLASIMAMQPSVLILDEPTSQLDPIAAWDFLTTLSKINRELGTTIILTEHRLDEALPLADRAVVMDTGKIIADGEPKEVGQILKDADHKMFLAMPVPMRVYAGVKNKLPCPITVREGRQWLDDFAKDHLVSYKKTGKIESDLASRLPTVEICEAWFKYEKAQENIVKGASLKAYSGEFLAILGGNGTGKTTLLSLISGINKSYRGEVHVGGTLGVVPQDPQSLFVKKTVKLDLYEMKKDEKAVNRIASLCDLSGLMDQHPYDLSGGEQQRLALAKVLLLDPEILLLDEPTKGMDAEFKQTFAGIIKHLLTRGVTVIMVSHDIEFCAKYADRCALFFDGGIVTEAGPQEFFTGNSFYTTAANRMSRHMIAEVVTAEDAIRACGGVVEAEPGQDFHDDEIEKQTSGKNKFPNIKRKMTALLSFCILVAVILRGFPIISDIGWAGLRGELGNSRFVSLKDQWQYFVLMVILISSLAGFLLSIFQRGEKPHQDLLQTRKEKRVLSKRTLVASMLVLLIIPLTIYIGIFYLGDRKYYFISLLIILETSLPFAMIFEGRKPQARELVVIAVLCAIAVSGRAAFFMLPQFKPVAALVIISGIAFGGESGFLVGAMTMFISNMMYGQGPLTPWQMFSMGIIGFLSGVLFRKGLLRRDRISMAVFGGIAVLFVYGGIMNPASVLTFQSHVSWPMIISSWLVGAPFDLIHSAATVFFLLLIGEPMLEKLDRIKVKYGLVES